MINNEEFTYPVTKKVLLLIISLQMPPLLPHLGIFLTDRVN